MTGTVKTFHSTVMVLMLLSDKKVPICFVYYNHFAIFAKKTGSYMASFDVIGVIERITYLPQQGGCLLFLSEYRKGYKRKDGVRVDDRVDQWRIIFKQGLTKYISDHFSNGMTVRVKGDVRPFAVEHGQFVEGYSVFGETCNLFSYPRQSAILEKRAIRESQQTSDGVPNVDAFNEPDF